MLIWWGEESHSMFDKLKTNIIISNPSLLYLTFTEQYDKTIP